MKISCDKKYERLYHHYILPNLAIIVIFLAGFAHRCYFYAAFPRPDLQPDSKTYIRMATNIARHGTLSNQDPSMINPKPSAYVMPGYPFFLTPFIKIFPSQKVALEAVRLIQYLMGLILILIIYGIGKMIAGKAAGCLAAAIYVIYPTNWFIGMQILTEPVYIFLLMLFFYIILRALDKDRLILYAAAGIVYAMAGFIRAPVMPLGAFVVLFIFFKFRGRWKKMILRTFLFSMPLFLFLTTWIIRNAIQFDHFIPLTTGSNIAKILALDKEKRYPDLWETKGLSEYEYHKLWGEWGDELLRKKMEEGPWKFFQEQVAPQFAALLAFPYGTGPGQGWSTLTWREERTMIFIHRLFLWISLGGLIYFSFRNHRTLILWAFFILHVALHCVFSARARYGYSFAVPFFIFGGAIMASAGTEMHSFWKKKQFTVTGGFMLSFILFFILIFNKHEDNIHMLWWGGGLIFIGLLIFSLVKTVLYHSWKPKNIIPAATMFLIMSCNVVITPGLFKMNDITPIRAFSWGHLFSTSDEIEHVMEIPEHIKNYDRYFLFLRVRRGLSQDPEYTLNVHLNNRLIAEIGPDVIIPDERLRIRLPDQIVKNSRHLKIGLKLTGKADPRNAVLVRLRQDIFRGNSLYNGNGDDLSLEQGRQQGTYLLYLEAIKERKGKTERRLWLGKER